MDMLTDSKVFNLVHGYVDKEGVCHYEAEVREMTGVEEDILGDRRIPVGQRMDKILANCTVRIGTLTESKQIQTVIRKLTVADRLRLLIGVRIVSFEPSYAFRAKCSECGSENNFTVGLDTLEVDYPEDRLLRQLDIVLPSGAKCKFHILTGEDETKMAAARKDAKDLMSLAIMARLDELSGKKPDMAEIKRLSMRDRNFLRQNFMRTEGGVKTEVDVDCPSCGKAFKSECDIGQANFFFPNAEKSEDSE